MRSREEGKAARKAWNDFLRSLPPDMRKEMLLAEIQMMLSGIVFGSLIAALVIAIFSRGL